MNTFDRSSSTPTGDKTPAVVSSVSGRPSGRGSGSRLASVFFVTVILARRLRVGPLAGRVFVRFDLTKHLFVLLLGGGKFRDLGPLFFDRRLYEHRRD
jgi:hypothetical protein